MTTHTSLMNRLIKNVHKPNDPLTPLIDEYFIKRASAPHRFLKFEFNGEQRPRPAGRFSPSSICKCQRAAVFKFTGMQGTAVFNPQQEAIFDDGTWRHVKLDWQFYDMQEVLGPDVFKVVSVEEAVSYAPLFIKGSLDVVIKIRGVLFVVDFKGINDRGFEWVCQQGAPRKDHVYQLMCYQRMRKIKRGFLYYECKNDNRNKIFSVDWTPQGWREVQTWCSEAIEKMNRQQLPPLDPECKQGEYHFSRCPFAKFCFGSKTNAEVERLTYTSFESVEQLWEENLDV